MKNYTQRSNELLNTKVPGGVYLCQADGRVSCGACCGLYNFSHFSKTMLNRLLINRTKTFQSTLRSVPAIDAYLETIQAQEPAQRPFPDFHHCPFIGFIDDGYNLVGCLLHPLAKTNNGIDYRGLSYYGGMACHSYFCTSTRNMRARYKTILRSFINDWFLYGLVVTETKLVTALLQIVESELGAPLEPEMFSKRPRATDRLIDLLSLKIKWPFRPKEMNTACHYLFTDNAYPKPHIDYDQLGLKPCAYDTVLVELVSSFNSVKQLREAQHMIIRKTKALAASLAA
ncbi:MAG: hypothetical protein GY874_08485 [Desulfobacteraceae bacterium]|nr:hypothetical protein [Desulfobacteraceae bacterium]